MFTKRDRNEIRKIRHERVRKKISGTPEMPRLSVYRSLNNIYVQVIDDVAGKTLVSCSTLDPQIKGQLSELDKKGAGKLVGKTVAERALQAGIKKVVFDRAVAQLFILSADQIAANRSQHREKDQKQQHVVFPLSHITPAERFASSVIIGSENRPQSTMAAASTANGSFIRMPGSQLTTFSIPSSGRKYIDSAGPIR